MNKYTQNLLRDGLAFIFLLVFLAWMPLAGAGVIDRSDLNNDGTVDTLDLEIFSTEFLGQDWETVDWCNFYESSISNPKYFRKITSDRVAQYKGLFDFIATGYDCQVADQAVDKSDLNNDSVIDLADLIIFSTNYLERNWESVDWCVFHGSTLAGADYEGIRTKYFLKRFAMLLSFINVQYNCGGVEPPPNALQLENAPKYLARVADYAQLTGDFYITDPVVGSLFIYDANLVLKAEIKGLSQPLGVAIDSQGHILIGNNGRDNVEVYDLANGDLLAVFGEGRVKMPTAITLDDLGNIYVTDSRSHNVQVFDPAYKPVRTIGNASTGEGGLSFPVDAEIIPAVGTGTANQGEIFVADQGNYRVQVYDLVGNWLRSITFAGIGGQNCNWWTGICEIPGVPPFTRLQALSKDSLGRLHVLDNFGASVAIFDPADGTFVGAYGGFGTDAGLLRVPIDVLISTTDMAIVTAGDGDRIEVFAIQ